MQGTGAQVENHRTHYYLVEKKWCAGSVGSYYSPCVAATGNAMKPAQEKQCYIATILILCFTAGAMLAHASRQPLFNELDRIEAEIEAYRQGAVVGYVQMDDMGQLYFEEKP